MGNSKLGYMENVISMWRKTYIEEKALKRLRIGERLKKLQHQVQEQKSEKGLLVQLYKRTSSARNKGREGIF